MPVLAEAVVEVKADMSRLDKDLPQAHAKLDKFVGGAKASLAAVGVGLSIGAISSAIFDATKKASDFGETLSKVKTVFGGSSSVIIDKADELADKFGLVKQTTLDAAANIGLVGQAAGMSQGASAKLGVEMAQLAADASSFYNVGLDVSLEKIRAGLVGESEPLRAFGVLLSEDAVKAEAMRLGVAKNANSISDQAKVMARASIIVKGLATASGDLERTQDSAANQLKKFTGDLENFKVEAGESLIPVLVETIKLMRELGTATGASGKSFKELGGWAAATVTAVRGLGAFLGGGSKEDLKKVFGAGDTGPTSLVDPAAHEKMARESRERAGKATAADKMLDAAKDADFARALASVPKIRDLKAPDEKPLTGDERRAGEMEAATWRERKSDRDFSAKIDGLFSGLKTNLGSLAGAAPTLLGKLAMENPALKLLAVGARHAAVTERPKFESQIMSGDEFQRMAQTSVLNSAESRIPAETLDAIKEVKENSKGMLDNLKEIARKVGLPMPAVVKGRS